MEFRRKFGFLTLCHHLFLTISFFFLQFGVSTDTITPHHSLEGSETILSNSQTFKMGFFRPENSTKYYVGVMFNVPPITVVWVANRDKGMDDSRGSMGISEDGNLVVFDGEKRVVWSSSTSKSNISTTSSPANTTAQLLDTGNLVLKDSSSGRHLWESFGEISNTVVEGMKLGNGSSIGITREVRSWKSPWDPSPGTFSLRLRHQNIPELIVVQNNSKIYWRTGLWNKQIFIGARDMTSGYDYGSQIIKDVEGDITYDTFKNMKESTKLHYVLNSDGCYEEKHWDEEKSQWVGRSDQWVVKSEIGINGQQCDLYDKCGPFGIYDPYASKSCSCLKGYRPKDEMEWGNGNWSSGCIRKAALQCHRNSSNEENNKKDGFLKLQRMKVPDFARWVPSLDDSCETDCLRDCSCVAYSYYTGIGCMHWSEDLIDIQQFSTGGADLYIRLSYSEFDQKRNKKVIIIVITLTIGSLAIASWLYFGLVKHRGKKSSIMPRDDSSQAKLLDELPVFDFEIIAKATKHFHSSNKLGEGGFGPVYKGILEDGQEIAVKRLSESSVQGQKEFMNEVVVISKLQHRNLVRLLGCCIERGEKMLVYEFMPNGSLDALLFDPNKEVVLDWTKRFMIIEGIGRGLLYLHRDSRLRIVHRDLKASNILLDEQLNPKISDFGLARIFGSNQNQAKTQRVIGTYGYMAPEYAMNGRFSEKSDVYSFGVLLLEIISGRKNSAFYHDGFAISLVAHAWKLWNSEKMEEMAEPEVYDMNFKMSIRRCVHVGLLCVEEYADDRPNVSTVLSMLSSEIAELPHPKQPAFTGRQSSPYNKPSKQSKSSVYSITISDVEGR